ncbi:hypothetical protein JXA88_02520, partial [Candidatus Fermentibacteria bacterium]|nr:hypothetical protein [Candidatus Fermentibacteria bacterium]
MRYTTLLTLVFLTTAHARVNPGDFLSMPFDPSTAALGDAAEILRGGAASALRNPGIIGSMESREVFAAHTFLSLHRRLDAAAVAMPIGNHGTLAIAGVQAAVDKIDGRDLNGRHTGYLTDTRNAVSFVFGLRPIPQASFGIAIKALFREMSEETASGTAFDIGGRAEVYEGITVALTGRNLGIMRPKGRPMGAYWPWNSSYWSDDLQVQKDDRIPPSLAFSAASRSLPWGLRAGLGVAKTEGEAATVSGGLEYPVDNRLTLRAGGTVDSPALGASMLIPVSSALVTVGYAWSTGELTNDPIHRVSLTS